MDYTDFYIYGCAGRRDEALVTYPNDIVEPNKWDYWKIHFGVEQFPDNYMFYHVLGKRFYDIIEPLAVQPLLVSEKVINLLVDNNVTGWKSTEVRIYGHDELKYHVLMITGRCGYFDLGRSEIVYNQMPGGKFPYVKGLYFDMDSWDGSDLFLSPNKGFSVATKRVKQLFVKNKVTNISFTKISDYELAVGIFSEEERMKLNYPKVP